ncbi:MAG: hypothetical protein HRU15_06605 [Planctomycetes bacterium]|nr:hypothetical protein [Planctomycetota bacterium]
MPLVIHLGPLNVRIVDVYYVSHFIDVIYDENCVAVSDFELALTDGGLFAECLPFKFHLCMHGVATSGP